MTKLSDCIPGDSGVLLSMDLPADAPEMQKKYFYRLQEVGFLPGAKLKVVLEAPWSHDPIAVQVQEATFAIRKIDAQFIVLQKDDGPKNIEQKNSEQKT